MGLGGLLRKIAVKDLAMVDESMLVVLNLRSGIIPSHTTTKYEL